MARPFRIDSRRLTLACCVLVLAAGARAGEAAVAVAANFAAPLARVGEGFSAATGHRLKISAGATGQLYAQITAGAPFDVLLAADEETPRKLVAEGLAVAGSAFAYATGRLVLWSATPGVVDDQGAVLARGSFRHLAIANPKTAPYGRAAMQVLRSRGLADALAPRLVTGQNVAQTYQFVATGNAELGFVALSQLMTADPLAAGSRWVVPAALHAPIRQGAALLKAGADNPAAMALLAYLQGDAARRIIQAYGYAP